MTDTQKKYCTPSQAKASKKYISESLEALNAFTIRALNYLIKVEGLENSEEE